MDVYARRVLANIADLSFLVCLCGTISISLDMGFVAFFSLFILSDFMFSVVWRTFFYGTPGDIIFGVRLSGGFPFFLRLTARWFLGYISPMTAFLLHLPADSKRSMCEVISGLTNEKV